VNFKPGFDLHPGAAQDVTEIWEFIAQNSVLAARRVRVEIFDAVGALAAFPHQGHKRPDLTARPLRFLTVRDYLIAYRTGGKAPGRNCCAARPSQPARDRGHTRSKTLSLWMILTASAVLHNMLDL